MNIKHNKKLLQLGVFFDYVKIEDILLLKYEFVLVIIISIKNIYKNTKKKYKKY